MDREGAGNHMRAYILRKWALTYPITHAKDLLLYRYIKMIRRDHLRRLLPVFSQTNAEGDVQKIRRLNTYCRRTQSSLCLINSHRSNQVGNYKRPGCT